MSYPNYPSSAMQPNSSNRSRLRSTSTSGLPLNLDLRNQQYRALSNAASNHSMQTPSGSGGSRSAGGSGSSRQLGSSSSYSAAGYPSAPLTAPIDYHLPTRTSSSGFRSSTGGDYSMPQMSAPIAPSSDFSQAFSSMSGSSRRDTFGSAAGDRNDEYDQSSSSLSGLKRKRSFTGPGSSAATTGQGSYGSTT